MPVLLLLLPLSKQRQQRQQHGGSSGSSSSRAVVVAAHIFKLPCFPAFPCSPSGIKLVIGTVGVAAAALGRWQQLWAAARWRQCSGGRQHGGSVDSVAAMLTVQGQRRHGNGSAVAAAAAVAASWRLPAWRLRQQFGGFAASGAAAEQRGLRCLCTQPWWQQRHWQQQGWRGHRQQSTIH
jgi:hypothetical protein